MRTFPRYALRMNPLGEEGNSSRSALASPNRRRNTMFRVCRAILGRNRYCWRRLPAARRTCPRQRLSGFGRTPAFVRLAELRIRRQLQDGRALTLAELCHENDPAVGKLQRVMMHVRSAGIDRLAGCLPWLRATWQREDYIRTLGILRWRRINVCGEK